MLVARQASERPQCGSGQPDAYNTSAQTGGLFLILAVSVLSCGFPLAVKRFKWLPAPTKVLLICKHLGTGVILATCFVHLVPTAFTNLLNPCLPKFWTEDYPAMPGLIIMLGCLVVSGIEMIFISNDVEHTHQSSFTNAVQDPDSDLVHRDSGIEMASRRGRREDTGEQTDELDKPDDERLLIQCALLEGGILFHSIFIGMAIAFSTGSGFAILLVAISFHQLFEGLALGSRIAEVNAFASSSPKPWLMVLAYGITAPLGQAIGLAVHGSFDLQSQAGLLMVGIANAFSSGLLIYAGLVQFFYKDFLSDCSPLRQKKNRRQRIAAYIAFLVGAIGMSVTGAWA